MKVTVDDGRCGTRSATAPTTVVLRVVQQEKKGGKVLFDFDKPALQPEAKQQLGVVLQALGGALVGGGDGDNGGDAWDEIFNRLVTTSDNGGDGDGGGDPTVVLDAGYCWARAGGVGFAPQGTTWGVWDNLSTDRQKPAELCAECDRGGTAD